MATAKREDVMIPGMGGSMERPSAYVPASGKKRKDVKIPVESAPAASVGGGIDVSRFAAPPEPVAAPAPARRAPAPVAASDVVMGKVGSSKVGKTDPSVARRAREREPVRVVQRADDGGSDGGTAGQIATRGERSFADGMKLRSMADAKTTYQVANKNYRATKGLTDTMQGDAPVAREGRFDPAAAEARQDAPQAPPPVQVVVQTGQAPAAPAVPRGAVPVAAPGQMPTATVPTEAAPLEADPAELDPGTVMGGQPVAQPGNPGVIQRQLNAEEEAAVARVDVAEEEAAAMADASARYQASLAEAEAAKADQDARAKDQLDAYEIATKRVEEASRIAMEGAAVDPKRAWTTMGIGRKIGFTLSAAALGAAGNSEPEQWLRRYVDEDIEAQREEDAKRKANLGTAQEAANARGNMYQQTLAQVGDERVTADIVRVARIDQISADFKARLAKAGVRQLSREQEVMLTALEQDKAEAQARIQSAAANNPQMFTKSAYVYGAGQRAAMKEAGSGLIKEGIASIGRAEDQAGKMDLKRLDILEKEQARSAERGDKVAQQAYAFGKDTERLQATMGMVDELLAQDDIPGYGYTEGVETPGKMDTDGQIRLIIDELGRIKSGGAITEDEFASFEQMLMQGVTLGDGSIFEGSEARLRKNLKRVRGYMKLKVDAMERGVGADARTYYNKNIRNADFTARYSGGSGGGVVEED